MNVTDSDIPTERRSLTRSPFLTAAEAAACRRKLGIRITDDLPLTVVVSDNTETREQ